MAQNHINTQRDNQQGADNDKCFDRAKTCDKQYNSKADQRESKRGRFFCEGFSRFPAATRRLRLWRTLPAVIIMPPLLIAVYHTRITSDNYSDLLYTKSAAQVRKNIAANKITGQSAFFYTYLAISY
jgi:hypothetical protein